MRCVVEGCPKLRKLEIRDCPFGDDALLSGIEKYETVRSLWMSGCNLTMRGCKLLAREMPRLNVEVIKDGIEGPRLDVETIDDHVKVKKVYVYRSLAGRRQDAPPSVLTL
ncbi:protein auxin signaling F-box 3 [Phtheirospermum japonicum]|uniref:Protein auxin signaling F-box 3 n=1 Tax=Phtheirospermum japonicum TaxID=374723 RepID=A0A830CVP6_9LAMI|nr:protein auxin signaling F-box 3 [Phtheirospermum japonicum]